MLFKPLAALIARLRAKPDVEQRRSVYDLTDADIRALARLRSEEEWAVYLRLMDSVATYKGEALLYENDATKNAFLRGFIAALRETPLLVERLTNENVNARQPTAPVRADRRDAALYATPSWRPDDRGGP